MQVLGIRIDSLTKQQALDKVVGFLGSKGQYKIFTPNPEMLVDAQKDEYFKEVLNSGDLNLCDGFGITLVTNWKIKRLPGADFMLDICQLAVERGQTIYLLGSGNREAVAKTAEKLQFKYPKLRIVGYNEGPEIKTVKAGKRWLIQSDNEEVIHDIIMTAPDILFVGFGHGKQEKWIEENLPSLPSVKVAMGIGGSFDYMANKIKRAPQWMRQIGLEWFYRLVMQPWRIKRIFKAIFTFLYYVITTKQKTSQ